MWARNARKACAVAEVGGGGSLDKRRAAGEACAAPAAVWHRNSSRFGELKKRKVISGKPANGLPAFREADTGLRDLAALYSSPELLEQNGVRIRAARHQRVLQVRAKASGSTNMDCRLEPGQRVAMAVHNHAEVGQGGNYPVRRDPSVKRAGNLRAAVDERERKVLARGGQCFEVLSKGEVFRAAPP